MTPSMQIAEEWLPGDVRDRIRDLCRRKGIVLSKLTEDVKIGNSRLSRFLNSETNHLGYEDILKIARYFGVSTDFLLGETDEPERKHYAIGELGLTVKAAEKLYTGEVDGKTLCCLLEHDNCGELLQQIAVYLDGTLSSGIIAQNQIISSLQEMLCAQASVCPADSTATAAILPQLNIAKQPPETQESGNISRGFSRLLRDLWKNRRERAERNKQSVLLTKNIMKSMMGSLSHGKQSPNLRQITPEALADAVIGCMMPASEKSPTNPDAEKAMRMIRDGLVLYFKATKATKELGNDQRGTLSEIPVG